MRGCRLPPDAALPPQTKTDMGFLMSPGDGAVSAVRFFAPAAAAAPTHLLSGAADGSISIWASGDDWDCLKTLPGHKCAPLRAHPTHSARPQPTGLQFKRFGRLWIIAPPLCSAPASPQCGREGPSPAEPAGRR